MKRRFQSNQNDAPLYKVIKMRTSETRNDEKFIVIKASSRAQFVEGMEAIVDRMEKLLTQYLVKVIQDEQFLNDVIEQSVSERNIDHVRQNTQVLRDAHNESLLKGDDFISILLTNYFYWDVESEDYNEEFVISGGLTNQQFKWEYLYDNYPEYDTINLVWDYDGTMHWSDTFDNFNTTGEIYRIIDVMFNYFWHQLPDVMVYDAIQQQFLSPITIENTLASLQASGKLPSDIIQNILADYSGVPSNVAELL